MKKYIASSIMECIRIWAQLSYGREPLFIQCVIRLGAYESQNLKCNIFGMNYVYFYWQMKRKTIILCRLLAKFWLNNQYLYNNKRTTTQVKHKLLGDRSVRSVQRKQFCLHRYTCSCNVSTDKQPTHQLLWLALLYIKTSSLISK